VSYGLTVRRGGEYNRLAEPRWRDPLDTSFAKRTGGRWNPPGSFGVLYLNRDERTARLRADHKLAGQPYGIEDLEPAEQHDLVVVDVPEAERLDCVTDSGLEAVGLPSSYPLRADGEPVGHHVCQQIGQRAYEADHTGIACRSAATGADGSDEELALFEGHTVPEVKHRRPFAAWYLGRRGPNG
jgi:RES domain-containing protein